MPVFEKTTPNDKGFTVAAPGVLRDLPGATMNLPPRTFTTWSVPIPIIAGELTCDPQNGDILLAARADASFNGHLEEFPDWPAILRMTREGEWSTVCAWKNLPHPKGLAVTPRGDLYASYQSGLAVRPIATGTWGPAPGFPVPSIPYQDDQVLLKPDGKILVARTQTVLEYDPATQSTTTLQIHGIWPFVRSMCLDKKGNLWIGDDSLLLRTPGGTTTRHPLGAKIGVPWSLSLDSEDRLWVGSFNGYARRTADGVWTADATGKAEGDWQVAGSCCDIYGDIWIGRYDDSLLQFTSFTKTQKGRAFWRADGSFTYVPDAGEVGLDLFSAPVTPAAGKPDPNVQIRVTIGQTAVRALDFSVGAITGEPVVINLASQATGAGSVAYAISKAPANGVVSVPAAFSGRRGRIVTYQSKAAFEGRDSFAYTAGTGASRSTGTVTIQVSKGQRTQWSVQGGAGLAVAAPGVLGTGGGSVVPPSPTWARHTDTLLSPAAVAFDPASGDLWAVGKSATDVVVVRRSPELQRNELPSSTFTPPLKTPRGVVVAADGRVWISDEANKLLQHRSAQGVWSSIATTDAPWGLALDGTGRLHVSFPAVGEVRRFDPPSTWTVVAAKDAAKGALVKPCGIAFGPTGDLWIADAGAHTIRRLQGTTWRPFPATATAGTAAGRFSGPTGVRVGPDGTAWVADSANMRVQSYTPTADTWSIVPAEGGTTPDLTGPIDLALDAYNNLWVADRATGIQHRAPFLKGDYGAFELRTDGSFVYRAGNLTGYDAASVTVKGPSGTTTVGISVVVLGT